MNKIIVDFSENETVAKFLSDNLRKFNISKVGEYPYKPFVIYCTDENNQIIGGVKGEIFGGICRIYTAWIQEEYRRKGLGKNIFSTLDNFAIENNVKVIQLDTYDFQAREFYEKVGYKVIATLPHNLFEHTTYILRKQL